MTAHSQREADRHLDEILGRVKYIGPEPPPSEDEVMDMVVHEIRAVRAKAVLEERLPCRIWNG